MQHRQHCCSHVLFKILGGDALSTSTSHLSLLGGTFESFGIGVSCSTKLILLYERVVLPSYHDSVFRSRFCLRSRAKCRPGAELPGFPAEISWAPVSCLWWFCTEPNPPLEGTMLWLWKKAHVSRVWRLEIWSLGLGFPGCTPDLVLSCSTQAAPGEVSSRRNGPSQRRPSFGTWMRATGTSKGVCL